MKRAFLYPTIGLAALATGYGCLKASAKVQDEDPDRQIELTVYTQDFAQVTEVRNVGLIDGTARVGLTGVSHSLDQSTVRYDWPEGSAAQITSTTYDLGTSSGQTLLEQLVGREVTLVYRSESGREGERQKGILEVAAPGNVVVRVGETLVINPNATIEAPAGQVATMPQLSASVENGREETQPLTLSYMTRGLSWSADYVMTLGDETAELECWATIVNQTGVDFPAAKIKFVAGSPNRAVVATNADTGLTLKYRYADDERGPAREDKSFKREMAGESVGELVAFPYESKGTLRNNQTNRVLLMKEPTVTVTRDYAIRLPSPGWYGYRDASERLTATLSLALKNTKDAGLGSPLPMGRVRVYEPAKKGAPVLIGAAGIGNTPKDDRIDMTLTEVFNLYARGKLVETKKLDKRRTQYSYEFTVANEKDRSVDVRLVAGFYGSWSITSESSKSTRPDASTAQWVVSVPAGGETKLSYTVVVG